MNETDRRSGWVRQVAARYGIAALTYTTIPLVLMGIGSFTGLLDRLPAWLLTGVRAASLPLVVVFLLGFASQWVARPAPPEPRPIRSPVRGRWRAMNSPASRVPSHGTHVYGQTYAIDLVHEPAPGRRPPFGSRHPMRDPRDYPAFGEPALAPIGGRVVRARGRSRDHRARSNWLGFVYMMVEGMVLSLRGAAGPMGNHVIIEADDGGAYAAIAHLQRRSLEVSAGDHVDAGQVIGRVGNSGNTSEPHVHLHLMDRADANRALGLPFVFTDVHVDEVAAPPPGVVPSTTVPANDQLFHAGVTAVTAGVRRTS